MQYAVCTVSSFNKNKIKYWYDYHKTKCSNVHIMHNRYDDHDFVEHNDFIKIDYPICVLYSVGIMMLFRYIHEYDYIVIMEHDAFITGNWLDRYINTMKQNNVNAAIPIVQYKKEHRKEFAYGYMCQKHGWNLDNYKWTLSNCYILDKKAIKVISDNYDGMMGVEVAFCNLLMNQCNCIENEYMNTRHNRSGVLQYHELINFHNSINKDAVLHSIKDYNNIKMLTGFDNGTDEKVLA